MYIFEQKHGASEEKKRGRGGGRKREERGE